MTTENTKDNRGLTMICTKELREGRQWLNWAEQACRILEKLETENREKADWAVNRRAAFEKEIEQAKGTLEELETAIRKTADWAVSRRAALEKEIEQAKGTLEKLNWAEQILAESDSK